MRLPLPKRFPKKYKLQDCAVKIGKDKNHFSVLKKTNPELFLALFKLGKSDMALGYKKYEDLYYKYSSKMASIFYFLQDNGGMSKFYRSDKRLTSLYTSESGFIQAMNNMAFPVSGVIVYPSFKKMRLILKIFIEQYGEEVLEDY